MTFDDPQTGQQRRTTGTVHRDLVARRDEWIGVFHQLGDNIIAVTNNFTL